MKRGKCSSCFRKVFSIQLLIILFVVILLLITGFSAWYLTYLNGVDAVNSVVKILHGSVQEQVRKKMDITVLAVEDEARLNVKLFKKGYLSSTNLVQQRDIQYAQWKKSRYTNFFHAENGFVYGYATSEVDGSCLRVQPKPSDTSSAFYIYGVDSDGGPVAEYGSGGVLRSLSEQGLEVDHVPGSAEWKPSIIYQRGNPDNDPPLLMQYVSAAHNSSGQFEGVINIAVDLLSLSSSMEEISKEVGNGCEIVIVDKNSKLVATTMGAALYRRVWSGSSFTDYLVHASDSEVTSVRDAYDYLVDNTDDILSVNEDKMHETAIDGKDVYLSFLPYAGGGDRDMKLTMILYLSKEKVLKKMNEGMVVTLLFVSAIVVVAILLSVLMTLMVTRPIRHVTKRMERAAYMDIDDEDDTGQYESVGTSTKSRDPDVVVMIDTGDGHQKNGSSTKKKKKKTKRYSLIKDVYMMEMALDRLVNNLREFRAFMPSTVCALSENVMDTEEGAESSIENEKKEIADDKARDDKHHDLEAGLKRASSRAKGLKVDGTRDTRRGTVIGTGLSIRISNIAVVIFDVHHFTELVKKLGSKKTIRVHGEWVDRMTSIIESEGGKVLDKFQCDKIISIFTSEDKENKIYIQKAAKVAYTCRMAMNDMQRQWVNDFAIEPVRMRCAVASGKGYVGNMGSTKMRAFAAISNALRRATKLMEVAKEYHLPIVLSEEIREHVDLIFLCRPVCIAQFFRGGSRTTCYELVEPRSVEDPIGEQQNRIYKEGFDAYTTGKFDDAVEKLGIIHAYTPGDKAVGTMLAHARQLLASADTKPPTAKKLFVDLL
eukprot:TRINITY_DN2614_c0_g1_i1.p1 TRINITY_DN2614_c0_g1~~TRINITY_DN2614_c0_g1_i1.p1  ORF type:complete len:923 (-),score=215.14 TRINITY_DN2614_c0_g1_i1:1922-4393(-)